MGSFPSSPEPPVLTEENLGSQEGKVYMITGSTSGIGLELSRVLYAAHATVWIVARSKDKGQRTISDIRSRVPASRGRLELLEVDFNDLTTLKAAVTNFFEKEQKLDVLWNNAGIMIPPKGTVTAQQFEAQIGVNALAPFLFTKLLTQALVNAAGAPGQSNETRVVWVSSSAAERFAPIGGVDIKYLSEDTDGYSQWQLYGMSKAANILLSAGYARRYGHHGIRSVAADPGNLDTNLYQNMPKAQRFVVKRLALKPAIYGAYTELFAGLSHAIKNGDWVVPWGKVARPRKDIELATRTTPEGGSGISERFWEWCEEKTLSFSQDVV